MRATLWLVGWLFLWLAPQAFAQDVSASRLSDLQRENEQLRTQLGAERLLRSQDRIAAAAAFQEILRDLSDVPSGGILEVQMNGDVRDQLATGFIFAPEYVVVPWMPDGSTLEELSRNRFEARLMSERADWHAAQFIGYRERCGCAVLRVPGAGGSPPRIQGEVFRGQVVWARGPWEGTLVGLVGNRRDLYIELDMANRGPNYGPVYDLEGALVGIIITRAHSVDYPERADIYFAVPAPLLAEEARLLLDERTRR